MLGYFIQVYKIIFLTIVFMVLGQVLPAQSISGVIRSYDVNDGLPSSTVFCSFQDSDGYMWFGTNNGASRFNGRSFENYSISDGLCDNNILNINEDSQGRIWFLARNNCLSFMKNGEIINSDSLTVLKIESADKGLLFFHEGADKALHFSGEGNERITLDSKLSNLSVDKLEVSPTSINSASSSKDGKLIMHTFSKKWADSLDVNQEFIRYIFPHNNNSIYTLSSLGISVTKEGKTNLLFGAADYPDLLSMDKLYLDNQDNIYCFSSKELGLLFEIKNGSYDSNPLELPYLSYSSIYVDSDNNQWFTTYESGVHLISDAQKQLTIYQYLENEQTSCLTLTPYGEIIAGTTGNRLLKFGERELNDLVQIGAYNDVSSFRDIAIDSATKFLWCAGEFRLMGLPIEKNVHLGLGIRRLIPLPLKEVNDIYPALDSLVYLATSQGIFRFHLDNPEATLVHLDIAPNKPANNIVQTKDGRVWFENNERLYYIEKDELKEFNTSDYSFKIKISSLHVLEDNTLVVCTFGSGVYFIRDDEIIHHLSEKNGLLSNLCNKIFIDKNRHYLASLEGVVIYDWNGNTTSVKSTYTHLDGLPSNVINDVIVKDSLVYLASNEGLIIFNSNFHSAYKAQKKSPPFLHLKEFKSKNNSFNFDNNVTLSYDDSFIHIDYEALSYIRPDEIIYEYKFRNSDKEWIPTKNTSLEFPRFEAGDYDFSIRARKHDSDWCEPVSFSFTSLPAWWASWWFRTIVIIGLGFITFIVIRFFAKRKYERQLVKIQKEQALLEERNRISADMHDDLGSELTKIVILSRIARTKLGLERGKEQPIIDIDNAATDVVKKMNEIIWALNPTNDSLESLASYLQKYVNDYLEVRDLYGRVAMPEVIPNLKVKAAFRRNVFLIVKECLHNIHKHAQADRVDMSIRISDDLEISITENGVGFDMEKTRRFGNGLINMKKRANDINGDVDQESSIGNGSSLIMTIPLIKNHAFVLEDN